MVKTVQTSDLLLILGWLVVYIYLAANFILLAMEKKVELSLKDWKASAFQIIRLLDKSHNPGSYISARIHFFGATLLIVCRMVYGLVRHA